MKWGDTKKTKAYESGAREIHSAWGSRIYFVFFFFCLYEKDG